MKKAYFSLSLSFIALLFSPLQAADVPGTLDTSFSSTWVQPGTRGITIDGKEMAFGLGVVVQQDGKIVISGPVQLPNNFCLVRLNLDGSLDTTFNASGAQPGVVQSGVAGTTGRNWGVQLQQDGKIVTVGWIYGPDRFAVARFNIDGTPDTTFNPGGVQPGTVATLISSTIVGQGSARSYGVTIQKDGKIVVAGDLISPAPDLGAVARFNTDGSLDATFNAAGGLPGTLSTTVSGSGCQFRAVAIQQDGKIVAAGSILNSANQAIGFAATRFNVDGTLDVTFNSSGTQPGTLGILVDNYNAYCGGVAIQQDGKIVLTGDTSSVVGSGSTINQCCVARLNTDGYLDTTFNATGSQPGIVTTCLNNEQGSCVAVVIQQDGKIVVAGETRVTSRKFAFARFNTDGTLDTSFNPAGVQPGTMAVLVDNAQAIARAAALQQDGKIIAVGRSVPDKYMTVARIFGGGTDFFTQRLIAKYNSRVLAQQG